MNNQLIDTSYSTEFNQQLSNENFAQIPSPTNNPSHIFSTSSLSPSTSALGRPPRANTSPSQSYMPSPTASNGNYFSPHQQQQPGAYSTYNQNSVPVSGNNQYYNTLFSNNPSQINNINGPASVPLNGQPAFNNPALSPSTRYLNPRAFPSPGSGSTSTPSSITNSPSTPSPNFNYSIPNNQHMNGSNYLYQNGPMQTPNPISSSHSSSTFPSPISSHPSPSAPSPTFQFPQSPSNNYSPYPPNLPNYPAPVTSSPFPSPSTAYSPYPGIPSHTRSIQEIDPNQTIFLGDLSYFCSEQDLAQLFSKFGKVIHVRIPRSPQGDSLMHGFISLDSPLSALEAVKNCNGLEFMGRVLRVQLTSDHDKKSVSSFSGAASTSLARNNYVQIHFSFISYQLINTITEVLLRKIFVCYGKIADVSIKKYRISEQKNNQSGYGFVYFYDLVSAKKALEALKRNTLYDITFDCNISNKSTSISSPVSMSPQLFNSPTMYSPSINSPCSPMNPCCFPTCPNCSTNSMNQIPYSTHGVIHPNITSHPNSLQQQSEVFNYNSSTTTSSSATSLPSPSSSFNPNNFYSNPHMRTNPLPNNGYNPTSPIPPNSNFSFDNNSSYSMVNCSSNLMNNAQSVSTNQSDSSHNSSKENSPNTSSPSPVVPGSSVPFGMPTTSTHMNITRKSIGRMKSIESTSSNDSFNQYNDYYEENNNDQDNVDNSSLSSTRNLEESLAASKISDF